MAPRSGSEEVVSKSITIIVTAATTHILMKTIAFLMVQGDYYQWCFKNRAMPSL
jgi:hypothetical protein